MKNCRSRWAKIVGVCLALVFAGAIDQPTKDALKVGHILKTIEMQTDRDGREENSAEVTEGELNAYIAYRLDREQQRLARQLTVKLLDGNRVQGRIQFDARTLQLDSLIGEQLDFDFTGILQTREGAGRLNLIALKLCGQPVKPQVLDFVIHTAALMVHQETSGIEDWYELPKGINHILISRGKAVLYY